MKTKLATLFAALSVLSAPALSTAAPDDTRASLARNTANDPESTVKYAASVYKTLIKDGKVPASVLSEAKCIAVFPQVVTAAVGIGGTHGDGVAFCRQNTSTAWSNPVFLNLTGASIGLQAGVKSADVVLFMTGDKARSRIETGRFTVAGDLNAVVGSFEKSFVAPASGVVAYSATSGVFAGASIDGVDITVDKDEQRAFYGTYDEKSMFEGPMPTSVEKSVSELRGMLPA